MPLYTAMYIEELRELWLQRGVTKKLVANGRSDIYK